MKNSMSLCFGIFLVLFALCGCKAKMITVQITIIKTSVSTVTVTTAPTTKVVPTTTPKLNSIPITLAVVAPGDYAGYVLPVYLTVNTIIHISWKVEGGPFRMTITSPNGKVLPVTSKGVVTTGTPELLDDSGGMVFCMSDSTYSGFDWGGEGYFNFTPNLVKGDAAVKITLNYYFEVKPTQDLPANSIG